VGDDAVLYRVEPIASSATLEKTQGVVELQLELNSSGEVLGVTVLKSPGRELDDRVTSAFRLWRFRPGTPSSILFRYQLPAPGEIAAPLLLSKKEPEMTAEARRVKQSGTAVYLVVVEPDSRLSHIRRREWKPAGLDSPGDFGLIESGKSALAAWRFQPATRNGQAVPVQAVVAVNFRWN
jgi:TonB family protein